jgi:hypothetical protein
VVSGKHIIACALVVLTGAALPVQASAQAVWRVDSVPALHLAGSAPSGEVLFERAAGVTRLSNGVIVIAEPTAGSLRYFDSSGRAIRTVGRRGTGPGEFRFISWLGQCGADTVFAWDFGQRRMTVVGPVGDVIRQYRMPPAPGAGPTPARLACSRGGTFAVIGQREGPLPDQSKPFGTQTLPLALADDRGSVRQSLGQINGYEYAVQGEGSIIPRPLGRLASVALATDRVYVGTADSAVIDVYSLDGRRLAPLRVRVARRPATRAHYERAVDQSVDYVTNLDARRGLRASFLRIPMPRELPPYSAMFVDPEQLLWVVLSAGGDPDTRLQALRADGTVVANVRIPIGLTVFEVGVDYILGGYEDEDGEPHVALFRLHRRPPS